MNPPPWTVLRPFAHFHLALVLLSRSFTTAVQSVGFLSRFRLQWLCTEVLMRRHAHYCISII